MHGSPHATDLLLHLLGIQLQEGACVGEGEGEREGERKMNREKEREEGKGRERGRREKGGGKKQ